MQVRCLCQESFLPGIAKHPQIIALLSCVGSGEGNNLCMAGTGVRCSRKKVRGNYCRQHYNEAASDTTKETYFQEMQHLFEKF